MFTIALALQKNEKWPKDLPVSNTYSSSTSGLKQQYKDLLTQHKDDVVDFVRNIRNLTKNIPSIPCGNDDYCNAFVEITQLDDQDYFLYRGYIESILDSVIAVKPQGDSDEQSLFGYSLAVRNNAPQDKDTYKYLQKVVYANEPKDADYTAMAVVGLAAYFAVYDKTEQAFVAITRDMGLNATYPDFDDDQQSVDVSKFANETASNHLFQFYNDYQTKSLVTYMKDYQQQTISELVSIFDFSGNASCQEFKATQGSYFRYTDKNHFTLDNDTYETHNFVQTFQEANDTKTITSDYRIVQMEKSLNSLEDDASLSSWWSALNNYPMRTSTTAAMVAFAVDEDNEKLYLTKCDSVYDAQGNTAACQNPPVPCDAASVVCSILIIIAVIATWVYGCIQAKKFDQLNESLNK